MGKQQKKWMPAPDFAEKLLLLLVGILVYLALHHFDVVRTALAKLGSILLPFAEGAVIAYLLDMPTRFLEKHGFHNRKVAVAGTLVLTGLLLALLVNRLLPQIATNFVQLLRSLPYYYDRMISWLSEVLTLAGLDGKAALAPLHEYRTLVSRGAELAYGMLYQLPAYGRAIGSGLVNAVTALASAVYMLLDKETLLRQLRKCCHALLPGGAARFTVRVLEMANEKCSGFLQGKCIDSLIVGLLTWGATSVLGLPYAGLISITVGVTNMVPIAGPILGAVPGLVILALDDPMDAVKFLVLILILQQLDGKIIGPRILGGRMGLSALWVLVALAVGGRVAGIGGMLLGVPVLATGSTLCGELLNEHLLRRRAREKAPDDAETESPLFGEGERKTKL